MRQILFASLLLLAVAPQPATEPAVRIGLNQNASTVTIRSASAFTVEQRTTRSATFSTVLALDPAAGGSLKKSDLQYRTTIELDGEIILVMPSGAHVRIAPAGAPLEIGTAAYRGALEVFPNTRHTLTVVNELPLED